MENKLNDSDNSILASLVDPDKIEEQPRYPYNDDFLRMLIGTLLCNRFFLCQSAGLIKPIYFRSEIHQNLCKILFKYFDDYKQPPSKIFLKELVDDHLKRRHPNLDDNYRTVKLLYATEINLVYDYYTKGGIGNMFPTLDSPDAILDRIATFAKTQAVKAAFAKSIELIRKNPESDDTWDKIDNLYKEARLVNRSFDIGLNYFETIEERYARNSSNEENLETFTMGFRSADGALMGGGLTRGELGAVMAKSGGGKSLWLAWVSSLNVARGKRVLYVSTEMDQDRIATRFDAMISNIGQHQLLLKKEEVWQALRDTVNDYEDKRRLIIKQFPSGTADMAAVRAYHAQLVMLGFKPDLVIFDYPGDMKEQGGIAPWDARFRLLREIRGFGVEEKHCSLIALHPNKSATELTLEEFMDESNQADAFKQDRVFDFFITLNRTKAEEKAGVGRGFIAKTRNGKSRFDFKIMYHFKDQTLKLQEISQHTYMSEMTKVQDDDVDRTETAIDKISVKSAKFEPSDGERVG
jgi:hypothetical protein